MDGLYLEGVEHYRRREYSQASEAFMRILEIDPGNPHAKRALEAIGSRKDR